MHALEEAPLIRGCSICPLLTSVPCPDRSPKLEDVIYTANSHEDVSEALACLSSARALRTLGLTPRNLALSPEHLHALGSLPLMELRLNSYVRPLCSPAHACNQP